MVDAGRVGRRQFEKRGGEFGDVYGATYVVAEQGAVAGAGGEFVHDLFVY